MEEKTMKKVRIRRRHLNTYSRNGQIIKLENDEIPIGAIEHPISISNPLIIITAEEIKE